MSDQKKIENIIFALGINPKEFANTTGINLKTLQDIIDGKREITVNLINRILRAFPHLSESYLKTGTGDVFLNKPLSDDKYFNRKVADAIENISVSVLNNSIANMERAKSEMERAKSELERAKAEGVYADGFNRLTIQYEHLLNLFEQIVKEKSK